MQYRTYKFNELPQPYNWAYISSDGSRTEFKNFDTLIYASGGAVAVYSIDNDYMLSNNCTVEITTETEAVAGQIIALINDHGAYDLGIVSSVDNKNRKILYKSMLSLFDVDVLNPARAPSGDDGFVKYLYDGVEGTAAILASYFASEGVDKYRRLPLRIRTSGGGKNSAGKYYVPAIWSDMSNTINVRKWLIDLFDKHNVVLQFRLIFETSRAYIEVYIFHNTTGGRLIKNNVHGMTVTHAEESAASATVCQVIATDNKALLSTWYLLSDNTVTKDASARNRVQPYRLIVSEFDQSNDDGATEQTIAENALLYSDFNHYVSIVIDKNHAVFPKNLQIGDAVRLVTEVDDMANTDIVKEDYADRIWQSIYTGRKEDSDKSLVTLLFGKIRINYTDLMQMKDAKSYRS